MEQDFVKLLVDIVVVFLSLLTMKLNMMMNSFLVWLDALIVISGYQYHFIQLQIKKGD